MADDTKLFDETETHDNEPKTESANEQTSDAQVTTLDLPHEEPQQDDAAAEPAQNESIEDAQTAEVPAGAETAASGIDAADAHEDAPAADAAPAPHVDVPDEVASLPLDSSAPSSASPASEETAGQADATAQDAPKADDTPAAAPVPALDASPLDAVKAEEPKADGSDADAGQTADKEAGSSAEQSGDKGLGATHAGTDTPEVMISNPCDPVTGKPLDLSGQLTGRPFFDSGDVPPKSEVGHAVPGDGLPGQSDGSAESSSGKDEQEVNFEMDATDDGAASKNDFGEIYSKLDAIDGLVADVRDALDGYEEC